MDNLSRKVKFTSLFVSVKPEGAGLVFFFLLLLLWFCILAGTSYSADYVVKEVNYGVYPQGEQAEVRSSALLECLEPKGSEVRLISPHVSLLSFETSTRGCEVSASAQGYFLYLPKRGSYSVRYSFKVPVKIEGARVHLTFDGLSSNLRKLEFKKAELRDISVDRGILKDGIWYLSSGSGVKASFVPVAEEVREVIINAKLSLVNRMRENRFSSSYDWSFRIEKGKMNELEFLVPEDLRVLSLKSASGVRRWWVDDKNHKLICQFQDELKGAISVSIEADRAFSSLPYSGVFKPIKPLNANRVEGEISFITEPYLSIETTGEDNLYRTAADKGREVSAKYIFSTIDFSLALGVDLKKTEFKVSTTQFLTLERYRQRLTLTTDFRILKQKLYQIEAEIPRNMFVTSVSGEDIKDWELEENRLKIKLSRPKEKAYSLMVELEKPYLELPGELEFRPVNFLESAQTSGYLGVGSPLALEVTVLKAVKVSPVEPARVEWPRNIPLPKLSYRFADVGAEVFLKTEKREPVVTAEIFSLYTLSEGYLTGNTTVEYKVDKAPLSRLGVLIPQELEEIRILGADIRSREKPELREKGVKYYGVELSKEVLGYYSLLISFRKKVEESRDLEVPQILASDAFRQSGEVVIASFLSLEISELMREGLEPVDARDIIPRHRSLVLAPIYLAYRQTRESFKLTLKPRRYEEIVFPSGVIERMDARSVVSREGELVTQVTYFLKNRTLQFLRLRLPPGGELWTAFVGDEAKVPRKDGDWILVDVPSQDDTTVVDIKYALQRSKLRSLKRVDFSLPETSNPVSFAEWTLYLPDTYRYHLYRGNVSFPDVGFNVFLSRLRHGSRLIRNFLIKSLQFLGAILPIIIVIGFIFAVIVLIIRSVRRKAREKRITVTVIGVLAVVAIIAVLAGMLLPAMSRARESARRAVSLSNVRQIGQAAKMYAIDYSGRFPDSLHQLKEYGLEGTNILVSPYAPEGEKYSYIITPGLSENVNNPSETILIRSRLEDHDYEGVNVFYVDGHAKWIIANELPPLPEEVAGKEEEVAALGLPLRIEIPREGIPLRSVRTLNLEPADVCNASFILFSRRFENGVLLLIILIIFVLIVSRKMATSKKKEPEDVSS